MRACSRCRGGRRRARPCDRDPPAGNRPGAVDPKDRTDGQAIALALFRGLSLAPNWTIHLWANARASALRVKDSVHRRAIRDSLRHCEGVRADLDAMAYRRGRSLATKFSTCCTAALTQMPRRRAACPRASCSPRSFSRWWQARRPSRRAFARRHSRTRSAPQRSTCPIAAV